MKKIHLCIIWGIYFVILSLSWFYFHHQILSLPLIVVGGLVGMVLPYLVEMGIFMVESKDLERIKSNRAPFIQSYITNVFSMKMLNTLDSPIRSPFFLVGLLITATYLVTSSQYVFGKAVVLGVILVSAIDLLQSRVSLEVLRKRWFQHTTLTNTELNLFIGAFMVWFCILTLIVPRI